MIYPSPHPAIAIPAISVHDAIRTSLAAAGRRPVLVAERTTHSGDEVAAAISRFAARLEDAGVGAGSTVCLAAPNSPAWLVAFVGSLAAGMTVTTANPGMPTDMVIGQLAVTRPSVILATRVLRDWATVVGDRFGAPVLFIDEALAAVDDQPPSTWRAVEVDAPAVMLSSSGTSGVPKSVVIPHEALVAAAHLVRGVTGRLGPAERVLMALPMFHAGGLSVALAALMLGGTLVVQPGFDPAAFASAIEEHRITFTIVVPPIAMAMLRHPAFDERDLSSLERVISTAAPLSEGVERQLTARLSPVVGQGYAMTEGIPITISDPTSPTYRPGTVGVAVPNTELRLVDPGTCADVEPGTSGELWVRGPQLMSGYLGSADRGLEDDGWLRTGDLCSIDENGVVTVEDRIKELIKTNGFQVTPAVLEAILLGYPGVADSAVIGRPHPAAGEVPVAFIVPAAGVTIDPAEVEAFTVERVPAYMRPAAISIVDDIPRNPTGKILRRVLREHDRQAVGT